MGSCCLVLKLCESFCVVSSRYRELETTVLSFGTRCSRPCGPRKLLYLASCHCYLGLPLIYAGHIHQMVPVFLPLNHIENHDTLDLKFQIVPGHGILRLRLFDHRLELDMVKKQGPWSLVTLSSGHL
jgi:hypothetical protein